MQRRRLNAEARRLTELVKFTEGQKSERQSENLKWRDGEGENTLDQGVELSKSL